MARNSRNHTEKLHNALVSQLAGTNNLPSLPHITAKLLDTIARPDVAIADLVDVIKLDPALSLNVMRLAQSIAGRTPSAVPDVAHAAQLIGRDTIAHLVHWSSTLDVFDTFSFCSPKDLTDFWAHSVKCALFAELLASELHFHDPSGAFLAGLLHDIGKLLLLTSFPTKYKLQFSESVEPEGHIVAEDNLVGDNHASAGAALVRRWRHGSLMADAILYHHHPAEAVANSFPLVKIVYSANLLANSVPSESASLDFALTRMLELNAAQLSSTVQSVNNSFEDFCGALGVDCSPAATDASPAPPSYTHAHTAVAAHVRDTSLLATLSYSLLHAEEAVDVLGLIEQTLLTHFDIDRVLFLLIDPDGNSLEAHGQCCDDLGKLTIPISYDACSPVLALTRRQTVDCFVTNSDPERSIMDDQLVHLLGKEGIVCLPMVADDEPVGTIVLGIDSAEHAGLAGQKQLLDRLSRYAARGLKKLQKPDAPDSKAQQEITQSVLTLTRQAVHEVNNPLGIINNYLSVLAKRLAEQDVAHDEIRIIREEIARIRGILKTLVQSSKEAAVSLAPVDLNALLSDLVRLMREDLSEHKGIEVHSHLNPSVPMALTNKDVLKQAIINLLKNSAEALTDGGNIHVETVFEPNGNAADHPSAGHLDSPAGRAQLIIRDDGPGIPEAVRARIFQPFVTSKDSHEGLGLSIVRRLIEQLNGTISYDPGTNSGTQFTISLPVVSP